MSPTHRTAPPDRCRHRLLDACRGGRRLRTAVVHPVDEWALAAAVDAAAAGVLEPVLVGSVTVIEAVAERVGVDLSAIAVVDAPGELAASAKAAEMAARGEVEAIMKGSVHTSVLLHEVLRPELGLRRSSWLSHTFAFDVPAYPKLLLLADAVVSVAPTLEQKEVICRHAIEVAHALGIERPKLAVLSANEDVDPHIPSSVEAAALAKMAERGQISGAVVDGPLAMDNAVSRLAVAAKGIDSPIGGDADILVVPNLEAGNILYKSLTHLAGAEAAGVALGAAVPIIVVSRSDTVQSRVASAALAGLLAADTARTAPSGLGRAGPTTLRRGRGST